MYETTSTPEKSRLERVQQVIAENPGHTDESERHSPPLLNPDSNALEQDLTLEQTPAEAKQEESLSSLERRFRSAHKRAADKTDEATDILYQIEDIQADLASHLMSTEANHEKATEYMKSWTKLKVKEERLNASVVMANEEMERLRQEIRTRVSDL